MKLDDRAQRHDVFFQRARRESYAARSIYKLEEIDRKVHLLRAGLRVLDLGCKPGSWLQYTSRIIGEKGALVGIDRTALDLVIPRSRIVTGDVFQVSTAELLGELTHFDVVMSDMAPDTSGIRSLDQTRSEALFARALEIATVTLAPGGHFVAKLFQGPQWPQLLAEVRRYFVTTRSIKPASSRKASIEQYVVGCGFRAK